MSIAVTEFSCAPYAPVWASSAPKPMKSAAKKYLFIEISQFGQARDLGGVELRALLISINRPEWQHHYIALIAGVRRRNLSASGTKRIIAPTELMSAMDPKWKSFSL